MSTSVREADRGRSSDEPLNYAPKRLRIANPDATAAAVPPPPASQKEVVPRAAEDAAPVQPAEPPWRRLSRRRGVFAGDVAIADLRARLALAPDRLPEPPPPTPRDMTLVWAGRLAGAAIVVAVGLAGYRWGASPTAFRFQFPHARHARVANPSPGGGQLAATVRPPPAARLNVAATAALSANDAARLDVSVSGGGAGAAVLIGGLASGTTLSVGEEVAPDAWRLSAAELTGAVLTPPRDFAGDMDLTVELRLADNVLADRKIMRLQWREGEPAARRAPAARHHDRTDIAEMVRRGGELMANGDVSAARLLYQRAAEAGETAAAFSLAETYDPLAPPKGEAGAAGPDPALARFWYKKARDLGSDEAGGRIERLGRINPAE